MREARAPVVVKLGGSVLTDKSRLKTLKPRSLARLSREVASAARERPLVLVHGAGSFGHVRAKRHRLADGAATGAIDDARLRGLAEVHRDVRELHAAVLSALGSARVAAVGLPPVALAGLDGGQLARFDTEPFALALSAGLVPVTFGDAVLDRSRVFGILSGDVLACELAKRLGAARLVFATSVDGVFDRAPSLPGATLLSRASAKDLESVAWSLDRPDVTRGMGGKLTAIAEAARAGVEVAVVNGEVAGRVRAAARLGRVTGTLVDGGRGGGD